MDESRKGPYAPLPPDVIGEQDEVIRAQLTKCISWIRADVANSLRHKRDCKPVDGNTEAISMAQHNVPNNLQSVAHDSSHSGDHLMGVGSHLSGPSHKIYLPEKRAPNIFQRDSPDLYNITDPLMAAGFDLSEPSIKFFSPTKRYVPNNHQCVLYDSSHSGDHLTVVGSHLSGSPHNVYSPEHYIPNNHPCVVHDSSHSGDQLMVAGSHLSGSPNNVYSPENRAPNNFQHESQNSYNIVDPLMAADCDLSGHSIGLYSPAQHNIPDNAQCVAHDSSHPGDHVMMLRSHLSGPSHKDYLPENGAPKNFQRDSGNSCNLADPLLAADCDLSGSSIALYSPTQPPVDDILKEDSEAEEELILLTQLETIVKCATNESDEDPSTYKNDQAAECSHAYEAPSGDDPTEMYVSTGPKSKSRRFASFFSKLKNGSGNPFTPSYTYQVPSKLMPMPTGMIICCVVVKGRLMSQNMVLIKYLQSQLRTVIKEKLSTKKRMMVVVADKKGMALVDSRRQTLRSINISSWLKMSETAHSIYFLDESRVIQEQDDDDDEMAILLKNDQEDPEGSETPPSVIDYDTLDDPLGIFRNRKIINARESNSGACCGLVAFVRALFKK